MLAAGVLCACTAPGSLDYRVHVYGKRSSFEQYELAAAALKTDGQLHYDGRFYREFTTEIDPARYADARFEIASHDGDKSLSTAVVRPFVCGAARTDYLARARAGSQVTETDELYLDPDGTLEVDTDFSIGELNHSCEVSSESGGSGEGVSTVFSSAALCTEPRRSKTHITLSVTDARGTVSLNASTCSAAYYLPKVQGHAEKVDVSFGFEPIAGRQFFAQLDRCLDPGTQPLPFTSSATDTLLACDGWTGIVVTDAGAEAEYAAGATGQWSVRTGSLAKGGALAGDVDLAVSRLRDGTQLRLSGTLDLPILRIPPAQGN